MLALASLLLVLLVLPALLRPTEFLRDDSYFYLQIADNIVAGRGSTFHGITPTNGYHPLWMAGSVASVFLADGDRTAALHVTVAVQLILSLAAALLFLRLTKNLGLGHPIVGAAVLLTCLFCTGVFGSEAHVNALTLVAAMLSLTLALNDDRAIRWFVTGLLFGLTMLARLDNVFVVAALCTLGILHNASGGFAQIARRATAGALGGLLVLLPYLAWNLVNYGHLVPISGAIKSTFPQFSFDVGRLGPVGELAVPFGILALIIGLWLDREPSRRLIWLGVGMGVVAHGLYVVSFTDHYTFWPWYYLPGMVAAALIGGWLPGWLAGRLRSDAGRARMHSLAYILTVAVLLAGAGRAWLKGFGPLQLEPLISEIRINEYRWAEEFAARWMKTNLPPGSRVFTFDWPGAFAWYSGLSILPMDGLVNDFRYNDELLAVGAERYLCANDVRYYLGLHESDGTIEQVDVPAPLYRKSAGVLSFHEEDLVVRVRDVVSDPDQALPFAMWRLRCQDPVSQTERGE